MELLIGFSFLGLFVLYLASNHKRKTLEDGIEEFSDARDFLERQTRGSQLRRSKTNHSR